MLKVGSVRSRTTISFTPEASSESDDSVVTSTPQVLNTVVTNTFRQGFVSEDALNFNYILDEYTEDLNGNGILDEGEDVNNNGVLDSTFEDINNNGRLDPINPVTILGGQVSEDGYTFVTDEEGKVDFTIRYPKQYSSWTNIEFQTTTRLDVIDGNVQSLIMTLPFAADDISTTDDAVITPWINNASPFGLGNVSCPDSLSIASNVPGEQTVVQVADEDIGAGYTISINGISPSTNNIDDNSDTQTASFMQAFDLGSLVNLFKQWFHPIGNPL